MNKELKKLLKSIPENLESYRDLKPVFVETYSDITCLNIETTENYRECAIELYNLKKDSTIKK